ncbi:unnamed protein product [Anisakis simplex]|uniref:Formyl-coenzyme A transferase n=1 Tax=Anisakis simplex TaxID=6269 RepID=A0A0M3JGP8_ANISI|nr:unnamed protein product [Anisakis simplex]
MRNVQDEDLLSAVRMKMFGEKTRQSHEWHPAKQLAKRFNVPDPYPSSNIVGVPCLQKTTKTETLWNLGGTAQELQYRLEKEGITKPVEEANKGIVDSTVRGDR